MIHGCFRIGHAHIKDNLAEELLKEVHTANKINLQPCNKQSLITASSKSLLGSGHHGLEERYASLSFTNCMGKGQWKNHAQTLNFPEIFGNEAFSLAILQDVEDGWGEIFQKQESRNETVDPWSSHDRRRILTLETDIPLEGI